MPKGVFYFGLALFLVQLFLLIVHGVTLEESHPVRQFLWHLDREKNYPTAFASLQLSFVACFALLIALTPHPRHHRLFWFFVGLVFAVYSLDEYWLLHELYTNRIDLLYTISGSFIILVATFWRFRSSDPSAKRYLLGFLTGFALVLFGGYSLDRLLVTCFSNIPAPHSLCIDWHPTEEILEMLGTNTIILSLAAYSRLGLPEREWRRRVVSASVVFYSLFLAVWLYPNWLPALGTSTHRAQTVAQLLDYNNLELRDFRYPNGPPQIGSDNLLVDIYLQARRPLSADFGYTLQLIDQESAEVVASVDAWSDRAAQDFEVGHPYRFRQQVNNLTDVPRNRALWLALLLWQQDITGLYRNLTISSQSDQLSFSKYHAILTEMVLPTETETTSAPALATFADGFELRQADFPAQVRAGAPLSVDFTWSTANDIDEDWTQFLHFVHEESDYFWNHDQPPLGARLPTRLWYAGLVDQETWQFTLPADLPAGRYQLYTGLYRLSDLARMTVYDEFGESLPDARLSLGFIQIQD